MWRWLNDPVVGDVCARGDVVEWKYQEHCHGTEVGMFVEVHPEAKAQEGGEVLGWGVPADLALMCARDSLPPLEAGGVDVTHGPFAVTVGRCVAGLQTDATCHIKRGVSDVYTP